MVVMIHPDGQYDPAFLRPIVEPILEGRADIVLGSRPTKIPAGRLELDLGEAQQPQQFSLDLVRAEGVVHLPAGRIETFFAANDDVAMLRCPIGVAPGMRLAAMRAFSVTVSPDS